MAKCGAKTRRGGVCKGQAMPNGRCRLHGGKTPETNQNAVKHGFYSKCYTEQEKNDLPSIKHGTLIAELELARTQLARAAGVPEFDENGEPNEYYKPDFIEKWTNTIGRLEKQHSEITSSGDPDEIPQTPVNIKVEVVDARKPESK